MTITDFSAWLECADLEDYEDVYTLYHSLAECADYGMFNTQVASGDSNAWIVRASYMDEALYLCSEKAKDIFLSIIEKHYCKEMDIESWYTCKRTADKDD